MGERKLATEFNYGGQAVIEGVLMRGARVMALAVRHPGGHIVMHTEPLTAPIYTSSWARLPFIRGLTLLWDALGLGIKSLMFSADVALAEEEVEFSSKAMWGTLAFSLALTIGLFFIAPLLIIHYLDQFIVSSLVSNLIEGIVRLAFFLGYIYVINFMPDIKRVFAYHGAEHKTINAYEAGAPLTPESVRRFPLAHPRCGTGFLLVVMVVSILVFSFLGRPPLFWRIASRILLIPVVAGISYEFIRFTAKHYQQHRLVRWLIAPSLALQSLTTREPDDSMLEVSITALKQVLLSEGRIPAEEAQSSPGVADAVPA
ncbi:MAG: DUF1385 domain-containing protein [Chloroflexi bacterium]|nr:DUF1385 domain-containing protein [Chloroflexota bacterium]